MPRKENHQPNATQTQISDNMARLILIVGEKTVRDDFERWKRLHGLFGWGLLLRAAEECDPLKRWPNQVEALCLQLQRECSHAPTVVAEAPKPDKALFAKLVQSVKSYQPSNALYDTLGQTVTDHELSSVSHGYNDGHEEQKT